MKLTKESIKHFRIYSKLAPDDSDMANIIDAIKILEQRLAMYEQLETVENMAGRL